MGKRESILSKMNDEKKERFKENPREVVREFLYSIKGARQFVDLTAEFQEVDETTVITVGRNNKQYVMNPGDIYVILEDGVKEAVNISGNSGTACINEIWKALCRLYDMYRPCEPIIPYERMSEIATQFKDQLKEYVDDDSEFLDICKELMDMSEKEMDYFGIDYKRYKLVEVQVSKRIVQTIKVIMPEEESIHNVDEYATSLYNLDDDESDFDYEDWEVYDWREIENGISSSRAKEYGCDEVWNADDFQ